MRKMPAIAMRLYSSSSRLNFFSVMTGSIRAVKRVVEANRLSVKLTLEYLIAP